MNRAILLLLVYYTILMTICTKNQRFRTTFDCFSCSSKTSSILTSSVSDYNDCGGMSSVSVVWLKCVRGNFGQSLGSSCATAVVRTVLDFFQDGVLIGHGVQKEPVIDPRVVPGQTNTNSVFSDIKVRDNLF